jgi:hypothetical protein
MTTTVAPGLTTFRWSSDDEADRFAVEDPATGEVITIVQGGGASQADRCFYADPPPRPPGVGGRARRHGAKFACTDPTTWPAPTTTHVTTDDQYDTVTVQAWSGLHPEQHRHPGHGSGGPRPIVRGTILRVQVQRIPAKTRRPKVLAALEHDCGGASRGGLGVEARLGDDFVSDGRGG